MKKSIAIFVMLALAACSTANAPVVRHDTPVSIEQSYFKAKYTYTTVLAGATGYKDVCFKQPKTSSCYGVVKKLRQLDNAVKAAEKKMDAAMATDDPSLEETALAAFSGAVGAFKTYKEGNVP